MDPYPLLCLLRQFPTAADYFDGGQHDCQEVLRALLDLLHEELVSRELIHGWGALPWAPSHAETYSCAWVHGPGFMHCRLTRCPCYAWPAAFSASIMPECPLSALVEL